MKKLIFRFYIIIFVNNNINTSYLIKKFINFI